MTVTIEVEGRDRGKQFLLTEMPASRAERWAQRALFALGRSGVDVPDNFMQAGAAGLVGMGIKAILGMPWDMAEPLLADMFTCIQYIPDPARPNVIRPLLEDDIEEVTTRLKLRDEVINLHVGFSIGAHLSRLWDQETSTDESTTNTSTYPTLLRA